MLLRHAEEMKRGLKKLLRGRQMLCLAFKFYQTNENLQQVYGIKELANVQLKNDDLVEFHDTWMKVINGQRNPG